MPNAKAAKTGDGAHECQLGLGCASLGNLFMNISSGASARNSCRIPRAAARAHLQPAPPAEAIAIVNEAWDRGIRWFDTAPYYGGSTYYGAPTPTTIGTIGTL